MNLDMPFREIHVLLVEHESRDHDNIINMLHYFSYKVTSVELASTALSIISKEKVQFDLAMVNMNSPDLLAAQLLHEATKIDLPIILMSNVEIDKQRALMAMEQGAYLCIQKPITMSMVRYLWQSVAREKDLRQKETKAFAKLMEHYNINAQEKECFGNFCVLESDQTNYNTTNLEQKHKSMPGNAKTFAQGHARCINKRKSDWMEWTVELHDKFMAAAKQLGQGRCYPKDILEIMNVPGLTRMQVASHLQKCRSAKWVAPNKRDANKAAGDCKEALTKSNKARARARAKTLRFGVMSFDEDDEQEYESSSRSRRDQAFNMINNYAGGGMGLDQHLLGDDDILSSNDDDPFRELLPITDISMLDHGFSGFRQGFHEDDFTCPSFVPDYDYDQVGLMADHHWFCGSLNPRVKREEEEEEETQQGPIDVRS